MPVSSRIDEEAGVVVHTATGRPSVEDIKAALEQRYTTPGFRLGMGTVWDFRDGTMEHLSVDEIQGILRYAVPQIDARGLGRAAIVVARDVDHAVASMFDGRMDGIPIERQVFWDMDEAVSWASRRPWDEENARPDC